MPELASIKQCTGCMGCVTVCPVKAISPTELSDGHSYISINPEACIECGLCEKTCPVVNGASYGEEAITSSFLAGWAEETLIRERGATSGVFGALASEILSQGGAVAGAVMDGDRCVYRLIDSPLLLGELQGSKYTASNPGTIYRDVVKALREGRKVLFSGLPCHVAACLSYVPPALKENLITVDIVCGGVSSPRLLEIFRINTPDFENVVSFRDKRKGWRPEGFRYNLRYRASDGSIKEQPSGLRNLITDGFACELTDRRSCYHCRFSFPARKSDITLGDLWGDKTYTEQHRAGVSLIIVHSVKGQRLLENSSVVLKETDSRQALNNNRRVFYGDSIKGAFPERRWFGPLSKVLPYSAIKRIYASDLRTWNPLWWPFAAYRLISFRLADRIARRKSSQMLKSLLKK